MGATGTDSLHYVILDPTGNITALVESPVEVDLQPSVADAIMGRHPEVEQVGFVSPVSAEGREGQVRGALRMAGGEFCGNASMCAAVLCSLRAGGASPGLTERRGGTRETIWLQVSGAARPVEVGLVGSPDGSFGAHIRMPEARGIEEMELACAAGPEGPPLRGTLPLVRMEGISHLVIEPSSALFALRALPEAAERAVRLWCEELAADGLGLMFLEELEPEPGSPQVVEGKAPDGPTRYRMTPLVYVPGSNTVFWENSCASGSSAVGMCLAARAGATVALALHEPGGILRVESDPATGKTWLYGSARVVGEYDLLP